MPNGNPSAVPRNHGRHERRQSVRVIPLSVTATISADVCRSREATHNASPLPFIAKHADRIPHIHVKDRRLGTNGGENTPFGEGDTQIRQILQAIRDNKWNIRPIIEFEYRVPQGSDRVAEIKKCLAYCRESLLA